MLSRESLRLVGQRIVVALFFILSGGFTSLMAYTFGSFWALCCGVLWTLAGFVWLGWPPLAAGLSTFPVLGTAVLLARLSAPLYRAKDQVSELVWFYGLQIFCVIVALTLIWTRIRKTSGRKFTPFVLSFALVLGAFSVDRAFVDKTEVHSFSMSWTTDGAAPWGRVDFDERDGTPVVLYRKYGTGYCFDVFFSDDLKRRLIESDKQRVMVEYEVTRDFGRERGYNIRSVDGLVFNVRGRELRPGYAHGGYALNGPGSGSCLH
jgi:hypothetical protein